MKSAALIRFIVCCLSLMPTATQGFQMFGGRKRRGEAAAASASSSSAADGKEEIVDKDVYIRAMHQLTGQQPEDTPKDYLVGKIDKVTLSIAGTPGLDLVETADRSLVVVSGLTQETKDNTGIQILDTIVRVNSPGGSGSDTEEPSYGYSESTKQLDLEQTASILMAASQHAMKQGITEIDLVLNRLVQIQYVSEEDAEKMKDK